MISFQRTVFETWLVDYLNEQIQARAMTRDEAVAHIKNSLERVKHARSHSADDADRIAASLISALAYDPV
jgi:hypothetical protein